jgi:hypothetical protein
MLVKLTLRVHLYDVPFNGIKLFILNWMCRLVKLEYPIRNMFFIGKTNILTIKMVVTTHQNVISVVTLSQANIHGNNNHLPAMLLPEPPLFADLLVPGFSF